MNIPDENPITRPNVPKSRALLGDVGDGGKRRNPLGDITNQKIGSDSSSILVHCSNKISQSKNASSRNRNLGTPGCDLSAISNFIVPYEDTGLSQSNNSTSTQPHDSAFISDSFKCPEVAYMVESSTDLGKDDEIVNIDSNLMDPQLCAVIACDIYKHLRASEVGKRPALDYMEKVQLNINASMRSILVDWLVEVAEEYRLLPETLYLAVNYVDRYLSGNVITKQNLQLLGITCMMIAAKYEEVCVPQVEDFCYITDNTYLRSELLEMESSVLNYLKFELTIPTAKCFLRRFVRAAQGKKEAPSLLFESLASYLTELSLLDYAMLRYIPSLVAASAVFLAKCILNPSRNPWNATLEHYTSYSARNLEECVKNLLQLCNESPLADVVAVRKKYSQHKYKFAAKKFCPASLPPELFLC